MSRPLALTSILVTLASCGGGDGDASTGPLPTAGPTYYANAKSIVDAKCATCHRPDDIGPFPLTTYDEVAAVASIVRTSIASGSMPPWQPSDDCNTFANDIDLTADETQLLLDWLDADAPAGDPTDEPPVEAGANDDFVADIRLELPEPYTPTKEPDDYRCQLIEWPEDETVYVTGLRVEPDQRAIVHHVIAFVAGPDQVDQYRAWDEAEEGPGYTCYGGPTASLGEGGQLGDVDPAALFAALEALGLSFADLQSGQLTAEQMGELFEAMGVETNTNAFASLGSWVPGVPAPPYPAGTGIKVEPGSLVIAQMHYNTNSAAPVPDQSTIEVMTAPTVDREAVVLLGVDLGWVSGGLLGDPMTIPAGESEVAHATTVTHEGVFATMARTALGLGPDDALMLHNANHHMHELGTSQRSTIDHADGTESCLLDIPDWDFDWQGSYPFAEPVRFGPGDALQMRCTWDNSAANQPVIEGEVREPTDVSWGEGTGDEMCLGGFYVTAE